MDLTIRIPNIGRINADSMAKLAFVCYFSHSTIDIVYSKILSMFGAQQAADILTLGTVYFPLILAILLSPKKYLKTEALAFLALIGVFFIGTLFFHPEYEYWYTRDYYGAWEYIFYPLNGIYAFLFVQLVDDPKELFKYLRICAWLMYLFFAYQIHAANERGYWGGVAGQNALGEFQYSVSFGYNVLMYMLVFLHCAFTDKKISDIFGAILGLFMITRYGSRGALLFLAVFLAVYGLQHFLYSKKTSVICIISACFLVFVLLFYRQLVGLLQMVLSGVDISSRALNMLLEGTITSDSGRSIIWSKAIQMIFENPWGYGAMGSQPGISEVNIAGYPHSVVLEILINFGVLFGMVILVFLAYYSIRILFGKKYKSWAGLFLVFFSTACSLFISLCFWSNTAFWTCLGIGFTCAGRRWNVVYPELIGKHRISERSSNN